MKRTIRAVFEDGVFKPLEPVSLAEGTEVDVVLPFRHRVDPDDPTGWKAIDRLMAEARALARKPARPPDDADA